MFPSNDQIITIVRRQLGKKEIITDHKLLEDLHAESADIVNILAIIEEKFNIFIPEESISTIRTVGDLIAASRDHSTDQHDNERE